MKTLFSILFDKISYLLYGDNKNVCDRSTKFY